MQGDDICERVCICTAYESFNSIGVLSSLLRLELSTQFASALCRLKSTELPKFTGERPHKYSTPVNNSPGSIQQSVIELAE